MKILGIDPGIASTGWGVIEVHDPHKVTYVASGTIKTFPDTIQVERLHLVRLAITTMFDFHKPDAAAMESLSFTRGPGKLESAEAVGVIRLAAWLLGHYVTDYKPTQVKKQVAGNGRADKSLVAEHVSGILDVPLFAKPSHVTDALAIALTHAIIEHGFFVRPVL